MFKLMIPWGGGVPCEVEEAVAEEISQKVWLERSKLAQAGFGFVSLTLHTKQKANEQPKESFPRTQQHNIVSPPAQ